MRRLVNLKTLIFLTSALLVLIFLSLSNRLVHRQSSQFSSTPTPIQFPKNIKIPYSDGLTLNGDFSKSLRGIILVSIDTLRTDPLGCYGNPDMVTPWLDRFAQRADLFERAIVQLPGTLPSHMSIFTSLYPRQHSVYPPDGMLSPFLTTLTEVLESAGIASAGFTEGGYVKGSFGFSRGFDVYEDGCSDWNVVLERGIQFIRTRSNDERFFLFLHTYQVHDPYTPPREFASIFGETPGMTIVESLGPNLQAHNAGSLSIGDADVEHFRNLYLAEVCYVDSLFRRLSSAICDAGLESEVALIVTSDHGEEFREHGKLAHEQIYDECTRVPLFLAVPRETSGKVIPGLVESIDIAPTILSLAGLPPHKQFQGFNLLDLVSQKKPRLHSTAYSETFAAKTIAIQEISGESETKFVLSNADVLSKAFLHFPRDVTLKVFGEAPSFKIKAYQHRRRLQILHNDQLIKDFTCYRYLWRNVDIPLSGAHEGEINEIRIVAEDCTVPSEVSDSLDSRCLSYAMIPSETCPVLDPCIFNLNADPQEQHGSFPKSLPEFNLLKSRAMADWMYQSPLTKPCKINPDLTLTEQLKEMGYIH